MELKIPSPEQTRWGSRAMKTVATANGVLNASKRHMVAPVQEVIETTYVLEEIAPIPPAELAWALPEPQIRYVHEPRNATYCFKELRLVEDSEKK